MRTDLWMFLVGGCALVLYLEVPGVARAVAQDLQGPYPAPDRALAGQPDPGVQSARQAAADDLSLPN